MSSERNADGRPRPHVEGFAGPARTPLVISGGRIVVGPRSHERDTDFLRAEAARSR
jgi:hypothetical protein